MRALVFTAVLLLAACQSEKRPGGGEAGAGGTDAPGGSGGTGEGGTGGTVDAQAPTITLTEPADGTTFDQPQVTVRGTVGDDTGVARLWWTDPADHRWDLPADGSREAAFEFEARLAEGENALVVVAEDAAGNRTELPLTLHLENPPDLRPRIEVFEPAREWVEEGSRVELRWRVSGTRPIQLVVYSTTEYPVDVSDATSERMGVGAGPTARFMLKAINALGETEAYAEVGVGSALRIWPREARIVPGARQALTVENAAYGVETTWTASGGEVQAGTGYPYTPPWFRAEAPGVYTLTATTDESEPRTASATITVAEGSSSVRGFRGVGGQFGDVNGYGPKDLAVDPGGTLWVPVPTRNGLASWRPEDGAWTFVGDPGWGDLDAVYRLQDGALLAIGQERLLRLEAGAEAWTAVSEALPEDANSSRRTVGPDGTLYVVRVHWSEPAALLALAPGAATFEELPLPAGIEPVALAFGPAGTMYLAGKDEADLTAVFSSGTPEGVWLDTGPVPFPAEPIRDLIVGGDGALHLAGRSLARRGDGAWETIGSFPTCAENELCGLFDLAVRSDGALLVLERSELYVREADGGFAAVGISIEAMHTRNRILGALRRVAEAPDGTLYVLGDLGVYGLPPGGGTWSVLGVPGIMPSADTGDLLVEADGSWTLAAGGWLGQDGHFSLYSRAVDGGAWTGSGNRAGNIYDAEPIEHIARDGAGHLYGHSEAFAVTFRVDAETGEVEPLPYDNRIRSLESSSGLAFGVTNDGTIYIAGYAGSEWHVYRLPRGATEWAVDWVLEEPTDFARTPDGALWAIDLWPRRLGPGGGAWQDVADGLPGSRCVDLAAADDGSLLVATERAGVFRLAPGATVWRPLGFGEPSLGAGRVASRGGRTWALADGRVFDLDAGTGSWLPADVWVPVRSSTVSIFEAAADGSLLIAEPDSLGLLQSFDGP